jgi:uncharacterized protein YwgA
VAKPGGVDFDYNFTWYIRGPYSSELADDGFYLSKRMAETLTPYAEDQNVIDKLTKVKHIIRNSNTAELVASYLFLYHNYGINTTDELMKRKPRVTQNQINDVMNEWYTAIAK